MKGIFWIVPLAAGLLLIPIAVYIFTFGHHISPDHSRWAEMGSAMGGVYTPILSTLTLAVLLSQLLVQRKANTFQANQAMLNNFRDEFRSKLTRLTAALAEARYDDIGLDAFDHVDDPDRTIAQAYATHLMDARPAILLCWQGMTTILTVLKRSNDPEYQRAGSTLMLDAIITLSYRNCYRLDNFNFSSNSLARSKGDFHFNEHLNDMFD